MKCINLNQEQYRNSIQPKTHKKLNKSQNYPGKAPLDAKKLENHSRGEGLTGQGVRHPLYKEKLKRREQKINYAQEQAARAEILLTEDQG